jgi:hypothetical protein
MQDGWHALRELESGNSNRSYNHAFGKVGE